MVYKKYTKKNGKTYGPYLYHNKRVGDKIVTFYHGKGEQERNYKPVVFMILGLLLLGIFTVIFYFIFFNQPLLAPDKVESNVARVVEGSLLQGKVSGILGEGNPKTVEFTLTNEEGTGVLYVSKVDFDQVAEILEAGLYESGSDTIEGRRYNEVPEIVAQEEVNYIPIIVTYTYDREFFDIDDEADVVEGEDSGLVNNDCQLDSDCDENQVCDQGLCTNETDGDGDGDHGLSSIDGDFPGEAIPFRECTINADCRSGRICENSICVPCTSNWVCEPWGSCIGNFRSRDCEDQSGCGFEDNPYPTTQYCGGGTGPGCFLAGTKVETDRGAKKIEEIGVGERVLSLNELTGEKVYSKVSETFVHQVPEYLIINKKIETTPNHPFYSNGDWVEARSLKVGDILSGINGPILVYSIEKVDGNVEVFNLEVEGNHNYYAEKVLVHNKQQAAQHQLIVPTVVASLREFFRVTPSTTGAAIVEKEFQVEIPYGASAFINKRKNYDFRVISVRKKTDGELISNGVLKIEESDRGWELYNYYTEKVIKRTGASFSLELADAKLTAPKEKSPNLHVVIKDDDGKNLFNGVIPLDVTLSTQQAVVRISSDLEIKAIKSVLPENKDNPEFRQEWARKFERTEEGGLIEFDLDEIPKEKILSFKKLTIYDREGRIVSEVIGDEEVRRSRNIRRASSERGPVIDVNENSESEDNSEEEDPVVGMPETAPPQADLDSSDVETVPEDGGNVPDNSDNVGSNNAHRGGVSITGAVTSIEEKSIVFALEESQESLEVVFDTLPAVSVPRLVENGIEVSIVAPDEELKEFFIGPVIGLVDLSAYNIAPDKLNIVDTNGDQVRIIGVSLKDGSNEVESVQFLGEMGGTYTVIIVITQAEHLDANRMFISDIYDSVKELDDLWSETINDLEYVRVQFERNLSSVNDITVFPRIVNGSPRIEIYEKDGSEGIALFENLTNNTYNKVYLTALNETQDTFDLRVVGGSLEFDHIIDPTNFSACQTFNFGDEGVWTLNNSYNESNNAVCISITTSNIIIDGQGNTILYNGTSGSSNPAILINTGSADITNITIRNITFMNFSQGILIQSNLSNSEIENVKIINSVSSSNGAIRIFMLGSGRVARNITLSGITINNTINSGIQLGSSGVSNISLINNTLLNIGRAAFEVSIIGNVNDTLIENNTIVNASNGINIIGSASRTLVRGNKIQDSRNISIWISTGRDTLIKGGIINGSSAQIGSAIQLSNVNTANTTIENVTFINTPGANYDLEILTGGLNGTKLVDMFYLGNYSFNNSGVGLVVRNSQYGEIAFLAGVNGTGNLSRDLQIRYNFAEIRSDLNNGLNRSANITLSGFTTAFLNASILRNGINCPSVVCKNLTTMSGVDNVTFNVTGWTNYSLFDNGIPVSSCGTIFTPGNYHLINTIVTNGTCFNITASDVEFNGKGYSIFGNGTGYGVIASGQDQVTVWNFGIYNFSTGIKLFNGLYNNMTNNTFFNNSYALEVNNSHYSHFEGNTIGSNIYGGITLTFAFNNTILSNEITNSTYGINISSSSDNLLMDNYVSQNSHGGIFVNSDIVGASERNVILNNTLVSNLRGIVLGQGASSVNNSFLINNYLYSNQFESILDLSGSENVNFLIYNNSFGEIRWSDISANGFLRNLTISEDLGNNLNLKIKDNYAEVRGYLYSGSKINSRANVTLYNLGERNFTGKSILKNGFVCGSNCSNFTALNASTVVFNVTGWTRYSVGNTIDTVVPLINFTSPTPYNDTILLFPNNSVIFNLSVIDTSQTYGFIDLDRSLLLWMRMDDTNSSGDLIDLSSYSSNGTRFGSPIKSLGYFNRSFSFNGTTDYVKMPPFNLSNVEYRQVTVSAWIYVNSFKNYNKIVSYNYDLIDETGKVDPGWVLFSNSSGDVVFAFAKGSQKKEVSAKIPSNVWVHVVGVAGSTLEIYVDGERSLTTEKNLAGEAVLNYEVGMDIGGEEIGTRFNGSIDEVLVFSRELESDEVKSLFDVTADKYAHNFVLGGGNHIFRGHAVDRFGHKNSTEERVMRVTQECGYLNLALTYAMTHNLVSNGTCFIINSTGVILNGNGWNLTGNASGDAVYSNNYSSFFISGLNARNFSNGIRLDNVNNNYTGTISANSFSRVGIGLNINSSKNIYADNNIIINATIGIQTVLGSYNRFENNSIINSSRFGLLINGSYRNDFSYGIIEGSKLDAIRLLPNSTENNLSSISIMNTNRSSYDLNILGGSNGTVLIDMPHVGNYSINNNTFAVRNSSYGEIRFLKTINVNGTNLTRDITIRDNLAIVRSDLNAGLNRSANVTLYSIGERGFNSPVILRDGVVCPTNLCRNFTALNDSTVIFNVTGWTNYSIGNNGTIVTLIAPPNANLTYNRMPTFNWTSNAADNYTLNVSFVKGNGVCDDVERYISGITTTNYIITLPLNCFYDVLGGNSGNYYKWKVRAHIGSQIGPWSEEWKLNLTSLIDIYLNNSVVNFSNLVPIPPSNTDNTTDNNPKPFVLENKGNIKVNVTINATRLWVSYPNNESNVYYQFKVDNYTIDVPGQPNSSFKWGQSQTVWTPLANVTTPKFAVSEFNWSAGSDMCEIDILVTIPPNEPPGAKNSSVTFVATIGE